MKTNKINKGTGAGGKNTNANGIQFEENVYLKDWIELCGYTLKPVSDKNRSSLFEIHSKKMIGYYGRQGQLYNALGLACNISKTQIKDVMSKRINPDAFILNTNTKQLIIFEKKWQQSSGSVDEKIQTAPFKISMFEKLLRGTGYKVKYEYILSNWFKQSAYRNIREYYASNKQVELWIEGLNLNSLKIEEYLK